MSDTSTGARRGGILGGSTTPASMRRRREGSGLVTPYDFRRPINLSREKAKLLEGCFESYARQASTVLTSALRAVSTVELVSVEQVTYAEYVETLGALTYLTIFNMDPVQEPAVLETPLAVTMTCIDKLLGGPGRAQPERPLTDLESSVVGRLYERLVAEVRVAFATLAPFESEIRTVEYDAALAQIAAAADAMVVARLQLRLGDTLFPLSLAISFTGLVPFLNQAESSGAVNDRDRARRQQSSARLAAGLQEIPVEVTVRFRTTPADPAELAGLGVGDVVQLKHPAQSPLDVTAADVVFAHATPGSQGHRLAALVVAPAHQEMP